MTLSLHTIKPKEGSRKSKKRVGRGLGSTGRYSGRGSKGQSSRSGGKSGLKLKGIRTIMLSIPKKRGFNSTKPKAQVVNVGDLARNFKDGSKVGPKQLLEKGLISETKTKIKILGNGTIGIKVSLSGCLVSESAKAKIEKAGGEVVAK
jgi:large subunit ribosomal protein L15